MDEKDSDDNEDENDQEPVDRDELRKNILDTMMPGETVLQVNKTINFDCFGGGEVSLCESWQFWLHVCSIESAESIRFC